MHAAGAIEFGPPVVAVWLTAAAGVAAAGSVAGCREHRKRNPFEDPKTVARGQNSVLWAFPDQKSETMEAVRVRRGFVPALILLPARSVHGLARYRQFQAYRLVLSKVVTWKWACCHICA